MQEKKYRILLVDDHPIVREGIIHILEINGSMEVCGQTNDYNKVNGLIAELKPDAVILELNLQSSDRFSLIGEIKSEFANLPILVFSMYDESKHAVSCIKAGANGYLMKRCAPEEIIKALSDIIEGKIYSSEFIKEQIINSLITSKINRNLIDNLSPQELQIFRLYGQGFQTIQIASRLGRSPKTIETHCLRIRKKMNLGSINELIATAGAYMINY